MSHYTSFCEVVIVVVVWKQEGRRHKKKQGSRREAKRRTKKGRRAGPPKPSGPIGTHQTHWVLGPTGFPSPRTTPVNFDGSVHHRTLRLLNFRETCPCTSLMSVLLFDCICTLAAWYARATRRHISVNTVFVPGRCSTFR